MLLSEIIYNIKNLRAGGVQSDDDNIADEQIAFIINYYRAKLIKQELDRGKDIKTIYVQNLGKVEVDTFDKNECCAIENCSIRTKLQLPKVTESNGKLNITFVGLLNGEPFQEYSSTSAYWKQYNKYTKNLPGYYYENGYIYLINLPNVMLSYINVKGVFEDPKQAEEFRTCKCNNDTNCIEGFDFEYPIPHYMVDTIVKMVADSEFRITFNKIDMTNNSLNEPTQTVTL